MCNEHDHNQSNRAADCSEQQPVGRRKFLKAGAAVGVAAGAAALGSTSTQAAGNPYADPEKAALPPSDMVLDLKSVEEHGTVANLGNLFRAAKAADLVVAVSPHYYYPTDKGWMFEGGLEKLMHKIGMFNRKGTHTLDGFEGSGADFMPEYKEFIFDGKTIVSSPHKVYGPEANDLVLQLRKNHVDQVILAGMSANLCVESHLRELLEQGFEVAVVRDATAAAMLPEGDGYLAAITNFRYIANALWTTEEAVKRIGGKA